jgi:hypothetical protein
MMRDHLAKTSYHHDLIFLDDKFAKTKKEFMNSGTLLQNI